MSFVAKGGRVVTDDMLDEWADDADNGEFGGRPGAVYSGSVVPGLPRTRGDDPNGDVWNISDALSAPHPRG